DRKRRSFEHCAIKIRLAVLSAQTDERGAGARPRLGCDASREKGEETHAPCTDRHGFGFRVEHAEALDTLFDGIVGRDVDEPVRRASSHERVAAEHVTIGWQAVEATRGWRSGIEHRADDRVGYEWQRVIAGASR